jgi:hypothetical protein
VAPHGDDVGEGRGGSASNGPRPVGAGGMVRPCHAASRNRGGGEADRWGQAALCRLAWVKWYSNHFKTVQTNSNKLQTVQTSTSLERTFLSWKNWN